MKISKEKEHQLSVRDNLYVSEDENTFQNEDILPSLPLPELKQTLDKYLDSVRPHVTEEEFNETERIVKEFENGVGKRLQEKLLKRAQQMRNWVIFNLKK